jgi:8-oxo-dGTP pyrophosphatase MutT (NUDIX family)
MTPSQPELVSADGRRFAGFAAAVLVFIVDPLTRRFLLLSSPAKRLRPGWECISGAVEAGETLLAALRREVAEEAGASVRLDVLGTVHAWTLRYDDEVQHLISTGFVAAYLGGDVDPGDEMAGSAVRWATLEEVQELQRSGSLIPEHPWVFERALECFDLWSSREASAQPGWEAVAVTPHQ